MSQLVQLAPLSPSPPVIGPLTDTFGRVHSDLRISVTDHCNIRCFYCMPEHGAAFAPTSSLLSFEQIATIVRVGVDLGIRKLRLTGGEPLLRPHLAKLIEQLAQIPEIDDLALTTNGVLLSNHAATLHRAGLRRLNIHLDTLDRERFRHITRRDDLPRVLAGLDAAQAMGFRSIKLNAVAIKGLSEPDILPLVHFARERGLELRFIEFMPLDAQNLWTSSSVLSMDELIATIEQAFGALTPVPDADPRAPATEFQLADGQRIGFIASVTRPFCLNCNRLRLTADGKLRNCLFARDETDIHSLLALPDPALHLENAFRRTVRSKWAGHDIHRSSFIAPERPMYSIGG